MCDRCDRASLTSSYYYRDPVDRVALVHSNESLQMFIGPSCPLLYGKPHPVRFILFQLFKEEFSNECYGTLERFYDHLAAWYHDT